MKNVMPALNFDQDKASMLSMKNRLVIIYFNYVIFITFVKLMSQPISCGKETCLGNLSHVVLDISKYFLICNDYFLNDPLKYDPEPQLSRKNIDASSSRKKQVVLAFSITQMGS